MSLKMPIARLTTNLVPYSEQLCLFHAFFGETEMHLTNGNNLGWKWRQGSALLEKWKWESCFPDLKRMKGGRRMPWMTRPSVAKALGSPGIAIFEFGFLSPDFLFSRSFTLLSMLEGTMNRVTTYKCLNNESSIRNY